MFGVGAARRGEGGEREGLGALLGPKSGRNRRVLERRLPQHVSPNGIGRDFGQRPDVAAQPVLDASKWTTPTPRQTHGKRPAPQ
eukprot:7287128-Pyramimonas_sp.AAC.1